MGALLDHGCTAVGDSHEQTRGIGTGIGGARGYAHIGVIEEIERRGYEIACIAGCSMGAVIGGIYAAGKLDEYRSWIESLDYLDVLRLVDVSFRLGAIRGDKVFGQIRKIVGEVNIEQLSIPYTAVAADLTNQQEIWFRKAACTRPCGPRRRSPACSHR